MSHEGYIHITCKQVKKLHYEQYYIVFKDYNKNTISRNI